MIKRRKTSNGIDGLYIEVVTKKEPTAEQNSNVISKQAAIQAVHDYFKTKLDKIPTEINENGYEVYSDMDKVNEFLSDNKHLSQKIKDLPPAKPKRGKWIKKEHLVPLAWDCSPMNPDNYDSDTHSEYEWYWHCSECDYEADRNFRPSWKYCLSCGSYNGGNEND